MCMWSWTFRKYEGNSLKQQESTDPLSFRWSHRRSLCFFLHKTKNKQKKGSCSVFFFTMKILSQVFMGLKVKNRPKNPICAGKRWGICDFYDGYSSFNSYGNWHNNNTYNYNNGESLCLSREREREDDDGGMFTTAPQRPRPPGGRSNPCIAQTDKCNCGFNIQCSE